MPFLSESRRMSSMPKRIDPKLEVRDVRLGDGSPGGVPDDDCRGVGGGQAGRCREESLRRWAAQAEIDGGQRQAA
jgi:transposase